MKSKIDINVDLGEGFNNESSIMPFISSVNVACGGHAGSMDLMLRCVDLALGNNVRIGAHPGFEDRTNFGRENLDIPLNELRRIIFKQIDLLKVICESKNATLSYIKAHGALYHLVCNELDYAIMILDLIKSYFPGVSIMGMPNLTTQTCNSISAIKLDKVDASRRLLGGTL